MQYLLLFLVFGTAFAELSIPENLIPKDDIEKTVRAKCEKHGGAGAFDNLNTGKDELKTCIEGQINATVFKDELEAAKKTGSMDEVFGKYCAKTPTIKKCVGKFTDTLRECLDTNERNTLNTTLDVLKKLGEFVCYNDGDRLAMFIAESGVECLRSQQDNIKTCANNTFFNKIPKEISANTLPALLIDEEKCSDLEDLRHCVVKQLENCENSTPANIIDSLFKFIRKNACKTKQKRHATMDSDNAILVLMRSLKKRCDKYGGKNSFKDFKTALTSAKSCLTEVSKRHVAFVHKYSDEVEKEFKDCSNDIILKTEDCLPEEEKNLPQFFFDILISAIKYGYQNGQSIKETFSSPETAQCLSTIKQNKHQLVECVALANSDSDEGTFKTKEDVCREVENVQVCVSKVIRKMCPVDIRLDKIKNDLFDIVKAQC